MVALLLLACESPVDFMTNHFGLQWCAIRSGVASAPFEKAVEDAKLQDADRDTRLAMAVIDGQACIAPSVDVFISNLERLPKRPGFDAAKSKAVRVANEIKRLGTAARTKLVESFDTEIGRARESLTMRVEKTPRVFADIAGDLQMKSPKSRFLVLLVPDAPAPGAATYRSVDGGVCVIGVRSFKDDELFESLLHEATHAMDDADTSGDNMLGRVRKALSSRGVSPTDPLMRDVPHAMIFAAAEHRAKLILGKDYVPFGVAHGAYERMGRVATVVRDAWTRYVAGKATADATVEAIVSGVTAQR